MLNPAHVLEIALLLLVAFLSGAVVGALARVAVSRLMPARALASPPVAVATPPKPEQAPALVAAPIIGEVVKTPTPTAPAEVPALDFTEALLALAGDRPAGPASQIRMPSIAPLPAVAVTKPADEMRPARAAGETTSGRVVAQPRSSTEPARLISAAAGSAEVIPFPLEKALVETSEPPVVVAAVSMPAAEPASPAVAEQQAATPEPTMPEPLVELELAPPIEAEAQPDAATAVELEVMPPVELEAQSKTETVDEAIASPSLSAAVAGADVAAADAPILASPAAIAQIAQPDATMPQVATRPEPVAATPPEPDGEDDEAAAMRAIEGNWSPRRSASPRTRRAALPEVSTEAAVVAPAAAAPATQAANPATRAEPEETPGKPTGIPAPRLGVKDDLTHVIGILPIIETALNSLGLYHFDQVAALTDENAAWIENHLGIGGRIGREHWREQARELALATAGTKKAAGQQ